MMGMETYNGLVRTPADAIILFEACRIGLLPRVQRRLSEKERQSIKSGSVFVWDEREAGMRRWTDGKSWSASRVSGSFLTYREMEGKRGGSNFDKNANRDGVQGEQNDSDGGPDGYRYKPDGLMKQSFSITTNNGQHLHLISYFSRAATNAQNLIQPTNDPQLRHIRPEKGMYPESTVHEQSTIPAVTQGPMGSPGYAPSPNQPPYVRPPPYGYAPHGWPPSPMHTPPPHPAYAPYYHPHGPYPGHSPLQNMQYPPPHHGPYAPQMTPFDRPPPPMGQSGMPPGPPGSYGQPPPNGYHTGYQYPANGYHSFQPPPLQTPQNQPQPSSYPPQPPQPQAQQAPQAQTQQQSQPPQPQQQYSSATQQPTPQSQAEETKRSDSHQSPQPERQASAGAQPQPAQPAQPQVSASGTTIPSISAMLNGGEGGQAPPRGSGRNSTSPRPLQDIPMHKLGFEASRDVQALRNLDKSTFKY